jgi:hypothetical protein
MPGCKEGDLAVVIAAKVCQLTVGSFVTVGKRVPLGFILHDVDSRITSSTKQRVIEDKVFIVSNKEFGSWLHADARLQPIRPPSTTKTTEVTKEKEYECY